MLTGAERRAVLALCRAAIRGCIEERARVAVPAVPLILAQKRGVFVTLKQAGQLRGCIGFPQPSRALGDAVVDAAVAAATEDPRFRPVSAGEIEDLEIEVSVLSVPAPAMATDVEPGRHGLIVSAQGRRGLLLPQVALEQGWDREEFLAGTCRKAGLAPDAWRHGAKIETFTAEVFSERDP